jgi:oligopeptide transport system substrate-binding protein
MNLLKEKKVDIIGRPMTTLPNYGINDLDDDIEAVFYPLSGIYCLWFNCRQPPFNNKKMRQAFNYAVDKEALRAVNLIEFDYATESILVNKPENRLDSNLMKANKDKAKKLFHEGLKELNMSHHDFKSLTINYASEMDRESLMKFLQKQWEETFPIRIKIQSFDWKTYFKCLLSGNYLVGGMELRYLWKDPLHVFSMFSQSTHAPNITGWKDSSFHDDFDKIKTCTDLIQRNFLLTEMELTLKEHLPIMPLYRLKGNYLKKKWIKNLETSEFFDIDFKNTFIEKK